MGEANKAYIILDSMRPHGVLLIPNITVRLLRLPKKPYWVCAVLCFTTISSQTISYYHMLAVCIHRYRKLRKIDLPSGNDKYSYGVESILIWIIVLLTSVPPFVNLERKDDLQLCRIDYIFGSSDRLAIIYFLVLCCLPWLLTNVIYVAVLRSMRARFIIVQPANHTILFRNTLDTVSPNTTGAPASVTMQPPTTNKGVGQRSNKVNKVIGYLLFVLNISVLSPSIMFGVILGGYNTVSVWLQVLAYVNNVSSPFIYSLTIAPLRDELKSTLKASLSRVQSVIVCKRV